MHLLTQASTFREEGLEGLYLCFPATLYASEKVISLKEGECRDVAS